MLLGTVHSIGGKGTSCCWSDPSCTIAAVPGPALDPQPFSRGKPTVTDRPHCDFVIGVKAIYQGAQLLYSPVARESTY